MKRVFYLSSCKSCIKALDALGEENFDELVDIKDNPAPPDVLDAAAEQLGGYEAVFNKRAIKYRSQGIKDRIQQDKDYRPHLLEEYTFMKRPLFEIDGSYYAGYSKKVLEEVQAKL